MKFVKDLSIVVFDFFNIFFEFLYQMFVSLMTNSNDYETIEEIRFQTEIDNLLKSEVTE